MGEHRQQRHLPDVSALAGHVGAGDEGDLVALQIEVGVVGDESLLGHPQLQHRVTAFLDLDAPLVSNVGPIPPLDPRQLGKAGQDIQLPQCGGGFLDRLEVVEHLLAQAKKQVVLQLRGPFFGAEDLRFHDLEVLGDEALAAGHGLFAHIVTRHLGEVRFGDFDVIAEHRVEADFQRRNAGAGDFVLLELGQPVLAASGCGAEFVQLRAEAIPDHSALLHRQGWFIGDGVAEQFDEVGEFAEQGAQVSELRGFETFLRRRDREEVALWGVGAGQGGHGHGRFDGGQLLQGQSQREKVARIPATKTQPADRAFQVTNLG